MSNHVDPYSIATDPDIYDEARSDASYLASKPACFAVFGPPGSGKSTVARIISQFWKCLLLTPETVVTEALTDPKYAPLLQDMLHSPNGIPEDMILELFRAKVHSEEARHYGFVLDDFPSPEIGIMTVQDQFEILKRLEMKIDAVIVIRFPLEDAVRRKEKLYFHSPSGILIPQHFFEESKDYTVRPEEFATEHESAADPVSSRPPDEDHSEDENTDEHGNEITADEQEHEETGSTVEHKASAAVVGKKAGKKKKKPKKDDDVDEEDEPTPNVVFSKKTKTSFGHHRRPTQLTKPRTIEELMETELTKPIEDVENDLVFFRQLYFPNTPIENGKIQVPCESVYLRLEESVEWTQEDYLDYKRSFLPELENFLSLYYPLKVVEVDGNMSLHKIPNLITSRFECMRLQKPPIPHPLNDLVALHNLMEEIPDDVEKQLEQALLIGAMSPRWRWKRSIFGVLCPVSVFEGEINAGKLPFVSSFLDRLYIFFDEARQKQFSRSPRIYVLPPNPKVPIRLALLGPVGSGRTTLAFRIANRTYAMVIDVGDLADRVVSEQRAKAAASAEVQATAFAIERIHTKQEEELFKAKETLRNLVRDLRMINPNADIPVDVKEILGEGRSLESPLEERASFAEAVSLTRPETPRFTLTPNLTEEQVDRLEHLERQVIEALNVYLSWKSEIAALDHQHPDVRSDVEKFMSTFIPDLSVFDSDRYIQLIKAELEKAMIAAAVPTGEFRGWILDNLYPHPATFTLLLELPGTFRLTDVILLGDPTEGFSLLRKHYVDNAVMVRYERMKTLPFITETSQPLGRNTLGVTEPEWEDMQTAFKKTYRDMSLIKEAASNAGLRVHELQIGDSVDKMVDIVAASHNKLFRFTASEYADEGEAEEEQPEEEEEEEDENGATKPIKAHVDENSEKTKPVGDSATYCPVALKDAGTLWPGNAENGVLIYKDKIYYFSTPEAKEKFASDPDAYLPDLHPPKQPPLKVFVVGPAGSGKTTHARKIAEMTNAFVINVRTFIMELCTPKLQNSPVDTFPLDPPTPYWKLPKRPLPGSSDVPKRDKALPDGVMPVKLSFLSDDPENPVPLTPTEQACADSLSGDSALPPEVLTEFFDVWMKEAPFAGNNLVFDGFPMYPEDARFLLDHGFFPDALIKTNSSLDGIVKRELPKQKAYWMQEKKKRDEKRMNSYATKKQEWTKKRSDKKKLLLDELDARKKEKQAEKERARLDALEKGDTEEPEPDDEEEEDEISKIDETLDEEFPEPQLEDEKGDEESEAEEDADDRLREELQEKIETTMGNVDGIMEAFEEQDIHPFSVNTSKAEAQAERSWRKHLDVVLEKRQHVMEKAYPVSGSMAKQMLDVHYKRLGKFGTWCPVKIRDGHPFPPPARKSTEWFPAIYRQYVYLCSNQTAREEFLRRPEYYVRQVEPRLCIPIRVAVIGPPKSGISTLSRRLMQEIGVPRITIGDGMRYVHDSLRNSELHRILSVYLLSGTQIPDTLEILCLEALLRTTDCQSRGWILDGYPTTISKLNVMMQRFIIPTLIIELVASNKTCVLRSVIENMSSRKARLPIFNNSHVIATRLAHYKNHLPEIKYYLSNILKNLIEYDGAASKWKLWDSAVSAVSERYLMVQNYVERRSKGLAAPLTGLCVTPFQLRSRLADAYGTYCPVALNEQGILVECLDSQKELLMIEFKEKYYLFATKENMEKFLLHPELYVPPLAKRVVPPADQRAAPVELTELESNWSFRLGFGGMDPVIYHDHECRSEGLKYGSHEFMAEYHGLIYLFINKDNRDRFVAQPDKFRLEPEPLKRPPPPNYPADSGDNSAVVPYLESRLGPFLMEALLEVTELRPKYPFCGYKESAMIFLANYLKNKNPAGEWFQRNIHADKLHKYEAVSQLAAHLFINIKSPLGSKDVPVQEPILERRADFDIVRHEVEEEHRQFVPI